jgi:putative hemolysin
MNLLLILLLTLLNGLFAMSEMALAASRKARLDALAAAQKPGASAALALMEHPTNFLSTVQVGITSIGLLNGIVGDSAFSPIVARWLLLAGAPERVAHFSATALVVTGITFITLIFGELVPKRIGQIYPEQIAAFMARPMTWLSRAARPFVLLLSNTTHAVLRLLPFDTQSTRSVTQEEIAASLVEGVDAGLIEEHEHRMVRNVFKLDERALSSIMVPRNEVVWLDAHTTVAQALHKLSAGDMRAHSWYPVCKDSLDEVVGIVGISQLLLPQHAAQTLEDVAEPAIFVPETISGMELLEQFRGHAHRLVFVVDEYGEVQGILTPHDLLEAITGELHAHTAQEAWGTRQENGSWLLDGMIPVNELKNKLDMEESLPEEENNHYNTLAGLLMFVSGELPFVGQETHCAGWRFVIQTLDGKRAEWVQASRLTDEPEQH